MKKIIMSMMLLASAMGAMAQEAESPVGKFSIIPRIGVGISNWSNNSLSYTDGTTVKSKYQAGFMGGVDFEYRATEEVGISLGAYYAQQGFKFPSNQSESKGDNKTTLDGINNVHVNLNYIQVPLLVKGYVTRQLALMVGAQVGFLCGDGKLKMDNSQMVIDKDGNSTVSASETSTSPWPTKKVDVSIPIGISYEYMGVILDARYNLGIVNVDNISSIKDEHGEAYINNKSKSKNFTITVGYRFTL